jgi:hypothetical protein
MSAAHKNLRPEQDATRFKGRAYRFIEFRYFNPSDVAEILEDIPANYGNIPPKEMLKETVYDLIRVAQATGMTDEQVDDVMRGIVERRAEELRSEFKSL